MEGYIPRPRAQSLRRHREVAKEMLMNMRGTDISDIAVPTRTRLQAETDDSDSDQYYPFPSARKQTPDVVDVPNEPTQAGMTFGCKQLYGGEEDKLGRFKWQTEIPTDVGKPVEDAESEKWAIIVRHVKTFNDPKKALSMHSILIQSPLLKELLQDVLSDYPGITVNLKRLEFSGRFEPLIHRWPQLKTAIQELKRRQKEGDNDMRIGERVAHAELLDSLLTKEFADVHEAITDMTKNGVVTYDHL